MSAASWSSGVGSYPLPSHLPVHLGLGQLGTQRLHLHPTPRTHTRRPFPCSCQSTYTYRVHLMPHVTCTCSAHPSCVPLAILWFLPQLYPRTSCARLPNISLAPRVTSLPACHPITPHHNSSPQCTHTLPVWRPQPQHTAGCLRYVRSPLRCVRSPPARPLLILTVYCMVTLPLRLPTRGWRGGSRTLRLLEALNRRSALQNM